MSADTTLPEEIIALIVKSISDPPTAARCLRVCSHWKSAIDRASYWRDLYYESVVPKKFEIPGDLPTDHRLNTAFWKKRVFLTYAVQKSIRQQKCLPRIIASTVIDATRCYYHPRSQSFNKTHCAVTWEFERSLDGSMDNQYMSELIKIGSTSPSHGFDSHCVVLHGNYALFCDVTPYRSVDPSSISIVKFNPSTYHIDLDKPKPTPVTIPDAQKLAKHVDPYSKYLVVASYSDDQNCTVNVVDLDTRQVIFTEQYKGRYTTLVAYGTKFALLTNLGVTVIDFITKKKVFSSKNNATDALLFDHTIYIVDKKRSITEVDFSEVYRGGKRTNYTVQIDGSVSKIFMFHGLFVLVGEYALYFYTPSFEQVAKFTLPQDDVANVVTLDNGKMAISFEDDGTIFNVSFNPQHSQQLVELDLIEPNGDVKRHTCNASDLLESFRKVNQQGEAVDGITSLYFHTTNQKRYGMLISVIPNQEEQLPANNEIAQRLIELKKTDVQPPYQTPFRNVGFAPFQSVRRYGINQPKRFQRTIGIFCEEKVGEEWMFVKPDTNEWKAILN